MTLDEQIEQLNKHNEKLEKELEYFLETDQLLSAAAAVGRSFDIGILISNLERLKELREDNEAL